MAAPTSARLAAGARRAVAPFPVEGDFFFGSVDVLLITGRLRVRSRSRSEHGVRHRLDLDLALDPDLDHTLHLYRSLSSFVAGGRGPNKKPTTVASRGFLSKSVQLRQEPAASPTPTTARTITCRMIP